MDRDEREEFPVGDWASVESKGVDVRNLLRRRGCEN
jgi:hypothetical protein